MLLKLLMNFASEWGILHSSGCSLEWLEQSAMCAPTYVGWQEIHRYWADSACQNIEDILSNIFYELISVKEFQK